MSDDLKIGSLFAKSGTIAKGFWKMSELYDSSAVEIPIAIINGAKDGPQVWIQCAVHGDEYVGTVAVQELLRKTDPKEISGAVVVIPWLNTLAFRNGSRMAPQDGMDMNRIYPGQDMSQAMHIFAHSELVVDTFFQELKKSDVVLDLHDGGWMGRMSPYIQYFATGGETAAKARAIAEASGMDLVWESAAAFVEKKAPGSVGTVTMPMGIPTLTVEIGGEGRAPQDDVHRMFCSIENILKHLGVLPGECVSHSTAKKIYVTKGNWLRPKHGGIYIGHAQPADMVKKGDLIAEVRDPFGETVEELRAPEDGVVIGMRTYGNIATGQYAGNVARVVDKLE